MDLFAFDDELVRWEVELPFQCGAARLTLLMTMAWHLRQRDSIRAGQLAQEAMALAGVAQANIAPRCLLIEAEAKWLFGQLDASRALAGEALHAFDACGDAIGRADAHWLLAWLAVDRGDSADTDAQLALAASAARAAGDTMRVDISDAAAGIFSAYRDLPTANVRWGQRFDLDASQPALVAGWINDFLGTCASQASDFGCSVRHLVRAYEKARTSGQLRRAISLATNIGNAFSGLNAHDAALEWMQRGLDLARPTGWPMSIGLCLLQTAETLRLLGQLDAAQIKLHEAMAILSSQPGSRIYAIGLEYQGDLALDCGDYVAALSSFALLEERGAALNQSDFQSAARRGQAHALSQLNRPDAALRMADAALVMAREHGDAYNQIAVLKVLAEIHAHHALPDPVPMMASSAALHYLQLAMEVAATIAGYSISGHLLDAAAHQYALAGDHARAYAIGLRASAAHQQTHSHQATNRLIAMQVQHQTERAETESSLHRQLAAAEAQRAEALQQTSATLAHLSAIGQEITAHLDEQAVFRALDRHVHGLLDATHFSICLLESSDLSDSPSDNDYLRCAFGVEAGKQLPAWRISMRDRDKNSVRCVRERREIVIDIGPDAVTPNLIPGTLPTLSLLFAPLLIGARVLGVMTVQALHASAYGERERLIFRTLCAYGAIALDNAQAYRQVAATLKALNATQDQLLEKNIELEQAYKTLEEVSLTDQLTGLRNRRFLLQHVDADVALTLRRYDACGRGAESEGKDLVFFMVDLDHFKAVNDQYGHAAGDAVLVQMQERLRDVFRESDYLIRWGGEEFLVLARATHREQAATVAERIRSIVAGRAFVLPGGALLTKTCSIGYACFPFLPSHPRLLSWSQVVELADQGLYIAKKGGRNGWAALYGTDVTRPDDFFARLIRQPEQMLHEGEARLVTSTRWVAGG